MHLKLITTHNTGGNYFYSYEDNQKNIVATYKQIYVEDFNRTKFFSTRGEIFCLFQFRFYPDKKESKEFNDHMMGKFILFGFAEFLEKLLE